MTDEPDLYPSAVGLFEQRLRAAKQAALGSTLGAPEGARRRPRSGIGICCSGGGVRSAAYNMGALQALSKAGVLEKADYLVAVSGGSYIASAFATVTRHTEGSLLRQQPAFAPGSPEEAFVRDHCSYLADRFGGKMRLFVALTLGIVVNIVFVGLLLFAVGRPLGWLYGWWQPPLRLADCSGPSACAAQPHLVGTHNWALAALAAGGLGLLIAVAYRMFHPYWGWRGIITKTATGFLVLGALIGIFAVALPELIIVVRSVFGGGHAVAPIGNVATQSTSTAVSKGRSNLFLASGAGLVASITVALTEVRQNLTSITSLEQDIKKAQKWYQSLGPKLRRIVVDLAGYLVGPLVVVASLLIVMNGGATHRYPRVGELVAWAGVGVAGLVVIRYADLTSWSMHPFYKQRLASAFSIKRVADGGRTIAVPVDYGDVLNLTSFDPAQMQAPFPELVICAAANISDEGIVPPGRPVDSFVFSPTVMGGPVVGAMKTQAYEEAIGKRRQRDATVPAAVAMSGAAVSPAMGKMTRGSLRFLLAMGNIRLGVWMPNPRRLPKGHRWLPANPRPRYLFNEIIGWHGINSHYLYITDGGHYDNLGLVELLRRKCATIYCFDATGDPVDRYSTLGDALAEARVEFGAMVKFSPQDLRPVVDGTSPGDHVLAPVTYDDGTRGTLVFVRASVTDQVPWDVEAYREGHTAFPNDPTLDQLFTGAQFEAYRNLGFSAATTAIAALNAAQGA